MAEVTPPPSGQGSSASGIAGVVVGVIAGIVVAVILSAVAFGVLSGPQSSCGGGVLLALAGLAASIALAAAAWWSLARLPGGGFGVGLFRGTLVTTAVYMLIPWPCSVGWGGVYAAFGACHH